MDALSALWTFPAIILAAMLIAWAAECGQFFISQGLALAVLAWVQTLPEFAVEAVIALDAAKDPAKVHLITANFTGSLRLFVGLGWPMVYFVSYLFGRSRKKEPGRWKICLEDEHSIAVVSLLPALVYFVAIYFKGTLNIFDGIILAVIYGVYFYLLSKMPPQDKEEIRDMGRIPKYVMRQKAPLNILLIIALFVLGTVIIYFSAHPFLNSMLAIALSLGISQFVFVQWVSPFLSEFPEKLSAFYWAKRVTKAPMALVNFVSSSINQWTILVAMIPFIYSFGTGKISTIVFDGHQRLEILLTVVQSYLGFLFLVSMEFSMGEAAALFILWLTQFIFPDTRSWIIWVYGAWAAVETARVMKNLGQRNAFVVFLKLCRERFNK
jgi:cation:H+ antiporter